MSEEYIVIDNICKSDSISLDGTICDDITGWKITAQLKDECGNCIELATSNVTGGSDDQIIVNSTSPTESNFTIMVPKNQTTCWSDIAYLYTQVETLNMVGGETEKLCLATAQIFFKTLGKNHND